MQRRALPDFQAVKQFPPNESGCTVQSLTGALGGLLSGKTGHKNLTVGESYECGITLEKFRDFKEGDIFEAFIMEEYQD